MGNTLTNSQFCHKLTEELPRQKLNKYRIERFDGTMLRIPHNGKNFFVIFGITRTYSDGTTVWMKMWYGAPTKMWHKPKIYGGTYFADRTINLRDEKSNFFHKNMKENNYSFDWICDNINSYILTNANNRD